MVVFYLILFIMTAVALSIHFINDRRIEKRILTEGEVFVPLKIGNLETWHMGFIVGVWTTVAILSFF